MRVLQVVDSLAPGGTETSMAVLAPSLVAGGVELHVAPLLERDGVGPRLVGAGAVLHAPPSRLGRRAAVQHLREVIRLVRPDVVHTALFEADVAGRVAGRREGVPVVSSIVSEMYGSEHRAEPGVRRTRLLAARAIDVSTARLVTRFHSVSASAADVMARRLFVDRDIVDVIPRGRDAAGLGRDPARRAGVRTELGLDDDALVCLAVGREVAAKAHDVLLRALPSVLTAHPSVVVVIAGGAGEASAPTTALVDTLGLGARVVRLGHRDDVPALLSAADLFVLPSRREGMSGAMVEALGCGVPVVCSDLPGLREIDSGAGAATFVTPGRPDDLARCIVEVLGDVGRRRSMSEAGLRRFDHAFRIDAVAARHVDQYERVAALRRTGH